MWPDPVADTEATKADRLREERDWWQKTCAYWKTVADEANWRIEGLSAGFEAACARLDAMDAEIEALRRAAVVETPEGMAADGLPAFPEFDVDNDDGSF